MLPSNLAAASHPISGSNTCFDSLAALTVAGAAKTSSPPSLSPPVAAFSGLVVNDWWCSLGWDAKTGIDGLCFESRQNLGQRWQGIYCEARGMLSWGRCVLAHTELGWMGLHLC